MKKVLSLAATLALLQVFTVTAWAQLVAGSPEDLLFKQIESAASTEERLELAMQFEREFPDSPANVLILTMIMNIYNQQQDSENAIAYAEKTLAVDEDNAEALIALTYNLAVTRSDIPRAIEYGQRAVAAIENMRNSEPPAGFTAESWAERADSLGTLAAQYLNYAETIR